MRPHSAQRAGSAKFSDHARVEVLVRVCLIQVSGQPGPPSDLVVVARSAKRIEVGLLPRPEEDLGVA
jgi:hypothetical protein